MIKKQFAFILTFISISIYQSCEKCGGGENYKFEVTEMGVRVQNVNEPDFDSTKNYHHDSLFLVLSVDKIQKIAALNNTPSLFVSSAMACSPAEPYSDDRILSFTLVANQDVSDSNNIQLQIGDTLNQFFVVDFPSNQPVPMNANFPSIVDNVGSFWLYKWDNQPTQPISISFDAYVSLSNGRNLTFRDIKMKIR
jgi:hypothetical protein